MSLSSAARNYGGQSAEERTEGRRLALIDAALTVGDTGGWRQITVDRVCQQARLSKRYFYESFADVDALANAVVEHTASGLITAVSVSRDNGSTVPELAHATIAALVAYLTDDPRRARVLFGELAMTDASAEHRARAIRRIAAEVIAIARKIHREPEAVDPMIETSAALLIGGTGHAILTWLEHEIAGNRETLIENLTTLWLITGDGTAAHLRDRATRTTRRPARRGGARAARE